MRALLVAALVATVAGCAAPAAQPGPAAPAKAAAPRPQQTLFFDVTLIDLETGKLVPDQSVLVEGTKILKVGRFDSFTAPAEARVVEAKGKTMLPAFTDMHVHLQRAEDLPLYVAHGVTQVRNMWGAPIHLDWKKRIADGTLLGPAIVTAGPILDGDKPVHDGSFIVTSAADAEAAIALHKQAGYDFVKIYSRLDPASYAAIAKAAQAAGLKIVGHVPRAVGLTAQVASEMTSIEHLTGMADAMPKLGGVAGLVEALKKGGAWSCPTRVVMTQWTLDDWGFAKALEGPALQYVPAADRATWVLEPLAELEKNRRNVAASDKLILELQRGTDRLLVGTDTGNPLIVPGATLHDELEHLVRIGLPPHQALRVAITNSARFLGQVGQRGAVAPGLQAELVLIAGNPLDDIRFTRDVVGVYSQGRYHDQKALDGFKEKVAATYRDPDPLGGRDTMKPKTPAKWSGTFTVTWKGIPFGGERVYFDTTPQGELHIAAELYDLHAGQWRTMSLFGGDDYKGKHLVLGTDGALGQGRVELRRADGQLQSDGVTTGGAKETGKAAIADGTHLIANRFIASFLVYRNKLQILPIGQTLDVEQVAVELGSRVRREPSKVRFLRLPDTKRTVDDKPVTMRRYELRAVGMKSELVTDADGYPEQFTATMFGQPLKVQRIDIE